MEIPAGIRLEPSSHLLLKQGECWCVPDIPMECFVPETALQIGQTMVELVQPESLTRDG